jgi:hypothetical protein
MDDEIEILPSAVNLERLSRILSYHISTASLYIASFFLPVLPIAALAAVLFAPYMVYVLLQERKYGWITFFVLLILLPILPVVLFLRHSDYFLIFLSLPLAFFYFYCFLLKITIRDWIVERNTWIQRHYNINEQINLFNDN